MPTLERKQFPLESQFAEFSLDKLRQITVPAFVESNQIGLDGIAYELAFESGFVSARYHWRFKPPPEWKSLGQFVAEMLEALERIEKMNQD